MLPILKRLLLKEDGGMGAGAIGGAGSAPTNSVGNGGVDGIGFGKNGEPGGRNNVLKTLRRKSPVSEEPEEKKLPKSEHNPFHQTLLNHGFNRTYRGGHVDSYEHNSGKHFMHVLTKFESGKYEWNHYVPSRDPNHIDHEHVRSGMHNEQLKTHLKNYGIKDEEVNEELQEHTLPTDDSKFAGHPVFDVSSDKFHQCRMGKRKFLRYEAYVGNDEMGERIRQYGRSHPNHPVILRDENTKALVFLRYGRNRGPKF